MKNLRDFFKMGVTWDGCIPGERAPAATVMSQRFVAIALEHIGDRWPTRPAQQAAGLDLSRRSLLDGKYGRTRATLALSILTRAGIVTRTRRKRVELGKVVEDMATTHVHPQLVALATAWAQERQARYERGLRGRFATPAEKTVTLPLNLSEHPGKPSIGAASSGVRGHKLTRSGVTN